MFEKTRDLARVFLHRAENPFVTIFNLENFFELREENLNIIQRIKIQIFTTCLFLFRYLYNYYDIKCQNMNFHSYQCEHLVQSNNFSNPNHYHYNNFFLD